MRHHRCIAAIVSCLVLVLLGAGPAAAQSTGDVVAQVDLRGYATIGDVGLDVNDLEDLARDLRDDDVAVVVLESEWPGGNDLIADDVVELAEEEWTVLVMSPFGADQLDVGASSAIVDSDAIDEAFDAAFDQPSRDPITFARAFADGLADADSGGGGGSGFLVVLVVLVVVVGIGLWLLSRRGKREGARRIEDAKGELRDDIAGVANDILELGDRADVAANEEASGHFQTANEIYLRVDQALPAASTFDAVDDLDDDLELAAWHLDTAEAIVDGTPRPERPDQTEPWEGDDRPAASTLPNPPPVAAPPPRPRPASRPRRSGGGGGSGLGTAVLGGMLGSVLSGGGGRGRSRGGLRTTPRNRRSSSRGASPRRRSTPRRSSRGRGRRRG